MLCSLSILGPRCNKPFGMRSRRITNAQVTASSMWDKNHAPFLARLHSQRQGRFMGAWSAKQNNRLQWIQVDLRQNGRVTEIATQGRADADQWVTQYYIKFSQDAANFAEYKINNGRKVGSTSFAGRLVLKTTFFSALASKLDTGLVNKG